MKISGISVYEVKPRWIFVKISTDEGLEGWGEMVSGTKTETVVAGAKEMGAYLLGRDPFEIERLWQEMYKSFFRGGPINGTVVSGLEMALWDIKGKALGVPVYELLGGRTREKVRVYASVMEKATDTETLTRCYRALKDQGFTAAKIFVNGPAQSRNEGRDEFFCGRVEEELEKVRICREAVGWDFDFVLEAHRGMTLPEAVSFGRAVEQYRPMVFEDPLTPDNMDSMAEVAAKVAVPIATGERFINLKEFEMAMERRVCQYIRPDVCAVGGITTSKKICALAEAHDVLVIPHNPLGPVSTAACLQERPGFCLNGAEDAMVKEPLRFENGCMVIPNAPGIGVELADNAQELYPAAERGSNSARRAFDGAVKDW